MAGKRHRGIRRTVSISTMGLESPVAENSPLPDYFKFKQKSTVLPSHSPRSVNASNQTPKHPAKPPLIDIDAVLAKASTAPSQPPPIVENSATSHTTFRSSGWEKSERKHPAKTPLIDIDAVLAKATALSQPPPVVKNSENSHTTFRSSMWDKNDRKCVGLGVVAALPIHTDASTGAKDGKSEAPPPIVSKNILTPRVTQQLVAPGLSHRETDMQRPSAFFLHDWTCNDDCDYLVCATLPTVNFLEACYLCKRQLSHGRDIYMYRGDQAFCSEECRYEQIVLDERKEKRGLPAIKMRTSASPVRSSNQQSGLTPGAAAAG